jgi:molybdenum cofactor biosynthesis protein B
VLTVSDSRTEATDTSGAAIKRRLAEAGHRVLDYRVVPDEPLHVARQVLDWLSDPGCDGVIVNGGTGIAARDRTYEAIAGLLEKRLDGFGELFRMLSYAEVGSAAMLSRAVAGIAGGKPVFSVPGATAAVELALARLILPELDHLLDQLGRGPAA